MIRAKTWIRFCALAFASITSGLAVDFQAQRIGAWHEYEGGRAMGIAMAGEIAYIALREGALLVMDCSDPAHPKKLSTLALFDPAYDLTLAENKIYVASKGSLRIIDVSDPSAPRELGNLATKGEIWDVSVAGDFAYLASTGFGLEIVNIADPATPMWVAGAKTGGSAGGVRAEGNRVYLGDGINGLEIYDVTNASSPRIAWKVQRDRVA
jgi:hypothetical protein